MADNDLDAGPCPVCGNTCRLSEALEQALRANAGEDSRLFACPFCGDFGLTRTARQYVHGELTPGSEPSRVLSYFLRRAQQRQSWPVFDSDTVKNILKNEKLPGLRQAADNAILWLGRNLVDPGEFQLIDKFEALVASAGVASPGVCEILLHGLADEGYVQLERDLIRMTYKGLLRYEELRTGTPTGHGAFMAMEFDDAKLDSIFNDVFRRAVGETGFSLKKLDDEPRAGLIDDRLRVEIRNARFLIADLTHGNQGAYWEAGFAEGLGKPVIYTCEKSVFEKQSSHFDTNHHLTVLWEADKPEKTAAALKATIRATLPEAKQSDEEE